MPPALAPSPASRDGSATPIVTSRPEIRKRTPVIAKAVRKPTRSLTTPPSSGPIALPAKSAVCMNPSAAARRWRGTVSETTVEIAATRPVTAPWRRRSTKSCSGVRTSPIAPITKQAPKSARWIISLRP